MFAVTAIDSFRDSFFEAGLDDDRDNDNLSFSDLSYGATSGPVVAVPRSRFPRNASDCTDDDSLAVRKFEELLPTLETVEHVRCALASLALDIDRSCVVISVEQGNVRLHSSTPDSSTTLSKRDSPPTQTSVCEDDANANHCGMVLVTSVDCSNEIIEAVDNALISSQAIKTDEICPVQLSAPCTSSKQALRKSSSPDPSCTLSRDPSLSEGGAEQPTEHKAPTSLLINNPNEVLAFLSSRLQGMQQLANKKIAKAWIKGICPKKQAKFPYQNNKKAEQTGQGLEIPSWWPDPDTDCRFVEPDHIRRDERLKLCLKLLRLRPTTQQLKIWNREKEDSLPTYAGDGWTKFLRSLAGPEIFDELPKEEDRRRQLKQRLMEQMYTVAEMEEDWYLGDRAGNGTFCWTEDDFERKKIPNKRARRLSVELNDEPQCSFIAAPGTLSTSKRCKNESLLSAMSPVPPNPNVATLATRSSGPALPDCTNSSDWTAHAVPIASEISRNNYPLQQQMVAQDPQSESFPPPDTTLPMRYGNLPSHSTHHWQPGLSYSDHYGPSLYSSQQENHADSQKYQPTQAPFSDWSGYEFAQPQHPTHRIHDVAEVRFGCVLEPHFQPLPPDPMHTPSSILPPAPLTHIFPRSTAYSAQLPHHQHFMTEETTERFRQSPDMPAQHSYHESRERWNRPLRHTAPRQSNGLPLTSLPDETSQT